MAKRKRVESVEEKVVPRKQVRVFWFGDNTGLVVDLPMADKWMKEIYAIAIGVSEEKKVTLQVADMDKDIDYAHHFGPKDPYALERIQEIAKNAFKTEKEFEDWLDKRE